MSESDKVRIPHIPGASMNQVDAAAVELGRKYTEVELLNAVSQMASSTGLTLAALVDRLGRQREDVETLLAIVNSCMKVARQCQRFAERKAAELGEHDPH